MNEDVTDFYDRLSPEYRDNMGWDWESAVRGEGAALNRFLGNVHDTPAPYALLDCSCGIGTQAIGLALMGHRVHATDLSPVSVDCARQESVNLGVSMTFDVADFRHLDEAVDDVFDVVITCDNSIAHCLNDDDLSAALTSMKSRLRPGGLLLLSVRDYDTLIVDKPRFNNEHVDDRPDGRRVVFQLWDWAGDGRQYRNNQFLIRETDGNYEVRHFQTELRALRREELMDAVRDAGFVEVSWHVPDDSGYYQPIVTARNR